MNLIEQIFRLELAGVNGAPCSIDDFVRQAQPLGNGQSVGSPGEADNQMISWRQCLEIEFHAGIHHARRGVGIGFQFRVMSGDQCCDAAPKEVIQQGARQGRTFLRVSAGA